VKRHGRHVYRDPRWPALRWATLRRDGFRCKECGARGRLDVDHVRPVRDAPELAFELNNLQALCWPCHTRKTDSEIRRAPPDPKRREWRDLLRKESPSCSNP
jgi:5-methylcytosine-specific restriction endonuclease McrA